MTSNGFEVVPFSALPDLIEVAALAEARVEDVAANLAALPDGIHGVAARAGGRVVATALCVDREIAPDGKRSLVRLEAAGADPAGAGLALVDWAVADGLPRGARRMVVSIAKAPGLGEALERRGYRLVESYVFMRRAGGPRDAGPLPEGHAERGIAEVGDETYLAVGNEAFAQTPGAFPLTLEDWRKIRSSPTYRDACVRLIEDAEGPVGFLRGQYAPGFAGEVEAIGLLARGRGRGLGRWLLRRTEELLAGEGATEIHLMVAATNTRAFALYQAEGYVEVSRRNTFEAKLYEEKPGAERV